MIIRFFYVLLISFAVLTSCGRKKDHSKDTTIPKRELIEILTEIHFKDGLKQYIKSRNYVYTQNDSLGVYDDILSAHGYIQPQLDSTLKYYSGEPEQLNKIYDEVIKRLTKMQAVYEKELKKNAETKKDSVRH